MVINGKFRDKSNVYILINTLLAIKWANAL